MSVLSVLSVVLASVALVGCNTIHGLAGPAPVTWPVTLAAAQTQTALHHFDVADTLLANYASRNSRDPDAVETIYWRALFSMDPANPNVSLPSALARFTDYLADPRPRDHTLEAASIQRLIGHIEGLAQVQGKDATALRDATLIPRDPRVPPQPGEMRLETAKPPDTSLTSDAEIKKLREDLAKANAELERIRKRLGQPPPRQPK